MRSNSQFVKGVSNMAGPGTKRTPRARGQAAVEIAITMPMMIFTVLGLLQMTVAYQARITTELAVFNAVRAGTLYRSQCAAMRQAAFTALIPSVGLNGRKGRTLRASYALAMDKLLTRNMAPDNARAAAGNVPLVVIDYWLTDARARFDDQLDITSGERVMKLNVRLAYFYEYRVPFANWIITRFWLATQTGAIWAGGVDPIMMTSRPRLPPVNNWLTGSLLPIAQRGIDNKYYTAPIVTRWSMRMMSDPLPAKLDNGLHRCNDNDDGFSSLGSL